MKCLTCLRNKTIALQIYVQPRASKTRIAGMHGDALKICITAPPVENKGNEAVIHFIADIFGVPKSAVSVKSGRQSRSKKVEIANISLDKARKILSKAIPKNT